MGKPTKYQTKLSLKEQRFVDAYLGSCNGNATEAALTAGYTRNRKSAAELGSRLLRKVKIRAVIEKRQAAQTAQEIADAAERDKVLSSILRLDSIEARDRIAAIKELNKCSGRHSIRHVQDVTERLSDIIAGSRAPE